MNSTNQIIDSEREHLSTSKSATILIAEDNAYVRIAASAMLKELGYHVLEATDGYDCLDIIHCRFDEITAALIDINIPGLKGDKVARQIIDMKHDFPVVLTSGYCNANVLKHFDSLEHFCFLHKPYNLSSLRSAISHVIDPVEAKEQAGLGWFA